MSPARPTIKIAVPNKGSLSESASAMLREAGYTQRSDEASGTHADAVRGRKPRRHHR